jgi:hypothetical protein
MRRTIIIIGIVILLAILSIGLYFLFFASKPASTTGTSGTTGSLPVTGNQTGNSSGNSGANTSGLGNNNSPTIGQNFGVVASSSVLDYFVSPVGAVTTINTDGTISQTSNGQSSVLSQLAIQNILSASFSYDGTKAFVSFGNPTTPQTSVFDIASKAWVSLPVGMQSPAWSPSDYRIAYATTNANGAQTFFTIDASKAKPTQVAAITLHAQGLAVAWPAKNELAFYTKPSAYSAGTILAFNIQNKNLTPIASEIYGLMAEWNTTAQSNGSVPAALIFSSGQSGIGGSLELTNSGGAMIQNLTFSTLPSKCTFAITTSTIAQTSSSSTPTATSTTYLFCGVPNDQDQFSMAHLPDDYDQMALFTTDSLYRINLSTGAVDTVLGTASNNIDASDVKFFNNALFFVNRYDQKLYTVSIPKN